MSEFPDVWLANADYTVIRRLDWRRALVMVLGGEADIVKESGHVVHSQHLRVPLPSIIALRVWRHDAYRVNRSLDSWAANRDILRRDNYTCAYCGGHGDTVDHVYPASRGGLNTWGNLVTACRACNGAKDDRTPEEAGMPLLWPPTVRSVELERAQQMVWRALDELYDSNLADISG